MIMNFIIIINGFAFVQHRRCDFSVIGARKSICRSAYYTKMRSAASQKQNYLAPISLWNSCDILLLIKKITIFTSLIKKK